MQILISGASIAGPVLAYWLTRHGHDVTVVERAAALRKTGGHAIDLFKPAVEITEKMGVLPQVQEHSTGTTRMTICRTGKRPTEVNLTNVYRATSDRHVEIMRDDLSEIYFNAGRNDVEYLFDDTITAISADGEVDFERAAPRRFDIVVGADGLHSGVRRLVFGEVASEYIGAYLGVLSLPKDTVPDGLNVVDAVPRRLVSVYTARHLDDARAVFLFRRDSPLDVHHRDVDRQKSLLREEFDGQSAQVDGWLKELDQTPSFYFDSVTQLLNDTWSRGRVTLVGDAGYCPGPAVGGSTSLAVYGAYVLAGELTRAGGDYTRAFAAYEKAMQSPVRESREVARRAAKTLVPTSPTGVWALAHGAQLLSHLPTPLARKLFGGGLGFKIPDSMQVEDYPAA